MNEAAALTDQYQHMGVLIAVVVLGAAFIIGIILGACNAKAPKFPSKTLVHVPKTAKPKPKQQRPRVRFEPVENDITWVNLATGEIRITNDDLTNDEEWTKVEAWETTA